MNEAGEGEWSEPVDILSGAGVPEPPEAPVCMPRTAHNVYVQWKTPCNNGAKISEYRLEYQKPGEHEFSSVSRVVSDTSNKVLSECIEGLVR